MSDPTAASLNDLVVHVPADGNPGALVTDPTERALLDEINRRIGARESLEHVIDFLAESTRAIAPCDRISVAFLEEDGARLVSHYTRAGYEPLHLRNGYSEEIAGGSLADVLARGTLRIIPDLERYAAARPESRSSSLLLAEGVRASMTCPLQVEGRTVGLLFRSARRPQVYDLHQAHLHLAIAERLSQAVEKTWRLAQLSTANRAYFELLGFITHELKSPLAAILTEAHLLVEGYAGPLAPAQRAVVDRIVRRGDHLHVLLRDYLDLARVEGGTLEPNRQHFDFRMDLLPRILAMLQPLLDAHRVRLATDIPATLPQLEADPQLLGIVLTNLLGNACKYGRPGGEVRISAAHDGAQFVLSVWNEGEGWPPDQHERLFRRFSRLDPRSARGTDGTGLGLYICWRIARAHGGRINARSEYRRWAEFQLQIPQPLRGTPSAA